MQPAQIYKRFMAIIQVNLGMLAGTASYTNCSKSMYTHTCNHLQPLYRSTGGNVTSARWQVTLCDPIRHMSSCSSEAKLLLTAICISLPGLASNPKYRCQIFNFLWVKVHPLSLSSLFFFLSSSPLLSILCCQTAFSYDDM